MRHLLFLFLFVGGGYVLESQGVQSNILFTLFGYVLGAIHVIIIDS